MKGYSVILAKDENGNLFRFKDEKSVWDGLTIVKPEKEAKRGKAENKSAQKEA